MKICSQRKWQQRYVMAFILKYGSDFLAIWGFLAFPYPLIKKRVLNFKRKSDENLKNRAKPTQTTHPHTCTTKTL
jgi:hypothetical protein